MTVRILALLLVSALLPAAPSGGAVDPTTAGEPVLSIAVGDGVDAAGSGDTLRYVVEVENGGTGSFEGSIRLVLEDFVEVSASGGDRDGGVVSWPLELGPGRAAEFEAEARVGEPTADAYQVVALAEARAADGTVIVRAADVDRIPGTEAPPPVPGLAPADPGSPTWLQPAAFGAAIAVTAVIGTIAVVMIRRRTSTRGSP